MVDASHWLAGLVLILFGAEVRKGGRGQCCQDHPLAINHTLKKWLFSVSTLGVHGWNHCRMFHRKDTMFTAVLRLINVLHGVKVHPLFLH